MSKQNQNTAEQLLTVDQAAHYLNVDRRTVERWTDDGTISHRNLGEGKKHDRYRYTMEDLDKAFAYVQATRPEEDRKFWQEHYNVGQLAAIMGITVDSFRVNERKKIPANQVKKLRGELGVKRKWFDKKFAEHVLSHRRKIL